MIQLFRKRQYYYAVISGTCAAWGSLCGKLSGNFSGDFSLDNVAQLVLKAIFICMMLTFNAAVWTYFVKALQASSTSIVPTVISTTCNYIVTAIAGIFIFKEQMSLLWCCGMFLVIAGMTLVTKSDSSLDSSKKDS